MIPALFPVILECTTCDMPVLLRLPTNPHPDGTITINLDHTENTYYRRAYRAHPCWPPL